VADDDLCTEFPRLLALYGGTVLMTLLVMGVWFYTASVQGELEAIRKRLRAFVASLAEGVDADAIAAFPVDHAEATPFHIELKKLFGRVASTDPDIDSIYVLRANTCAVLKKESPLSLEKVVERLGELGLAHRDNIHLAESLPGHYRIPKGDRKDRYYAWEEAPLLDNLAVNTRYRASLENLGLVVVGYSGLDQFVDDHGPTLAAEHSIKRVSGQAGQRAGPCDFPVLEEALKQVGCVGGRQGLAKECAADLFDGWAEVRGSICRLRWLGSCGSDLGRALTLVRARLTRLGIRNDGIIDCARWSVPDVRDSASLNRECFGGRIELPDVVSR